MFQLRSVNLQTLAIWIFVNANTLNCYIPQTFYLSLKCKENKLLHNEWFDLNHRVERRSLIWEYEKKKKKKVGGYLRYLQVPSKAR